MQRSVRIRTASYRNRYGSPESLIPSVGRFRATSLVVDIGMVVTVIVPKFCVQLSMRDDFAWRAYGLPMVMTVLSALPMHLISMGSPQTIDDCLPDDCGVILRCAEMLCFSTTVQE